MRLFKMLFSASIVILSSSLVFAGGMKYGKNMAQAHLGHVYKSWKDTPNKVGFLTILKEELNVATTHGIIAAKKNDDLAWLKTHTRHVRQAIDPSLENGGPGKGYGVIKAANGVQTHITFARQSEGATPNIKLHSTHIATSANNIVTWASEVIELSNQLLASYSAKDAAMKLNEINAILAKMNKGYDANGDGAVSWNKGEGGFAQSNRHLNILMKNEGLI